MADGNVVVPVVIGVDIGGTNTDVAFLHRKDGSPHVICDVKELTSSDVTTGVQKAVLRALLKTKQTGTVISPIQVNIGTTHFVNAVVQGKDLTKVAVIRICGPVSEELPPFCDFPTRLIKIIRGNSFLIHGGFRFDGKEHEPLDEGEIRRVVCEIKEQGIKNIAVTGIFSPTRPDQELQTRDIILDEFPEASVSLSHELGSIGILERENATILNECLKPLCQKTVDGFASALEDIGITCPFYLTQNDGTIISSSDVMKYPVLTFASGPTNSMRGSSFLCDKKDAVVVDIGGTTTDVGMIKNGFPREASAHVKVGGVRTNFRMPDVVSIGLGGGSYVKCQRSSDGKIHEVKVGPRSSGMNIKKEAMVFADSDEQLKERAMTATDVAVAAGLCNLGCRDRMKNQEESVIALSVEEIHRMVEDLVDRIKLTHENLPVIIVGGGSVLIDRHRPFRGATELIIPEYFGVANAIGAALSKVSVTSQAVVNLLDLVDLEAMNKAVTQTQNKGTGSNKDAKEIDQAVKEARKPFLNKARNKAIEDITERTKLAVVAKGGRDGSMEVLEKQDSVLSYMPGNAIELKVKVVADLAHQESTSSSNPESKYVEWKEPTNSETTLSKEYSRTEKQNASSTGQLIDGGNDVDKDDEDPKSHPKEPVIDERTGEWILNEWDIECIVVGAGIYGCGGGASPHMGRLRSLKSIRDGKRMRVVTPERLLKEDKNQLVAICAFIGAPLIMYEQGVSSKETTAALQCLRDVHEIGNFKDGKLQNTTGVVTETNDIGVTYISNYQPVEKDKIEANGEFKLVGLMSGEIGGLNALEPFLIAANLDLPILDCDGMSRAFPEVQMCIPFMHGKAPYPATIVGSGNCAKRSVMVHSSSTKQLENYLRDVSIDNGCSAGMSFSVDRDEVFNKTALYTVSSAWRLGDAILRARLNKESVIDTMVRLESAKHVLTGKVMDVKRETSDGFNRGHMTVEGVEEWKGQDILIEFQNENLVILALNKDNGHKGECLGSVPDLITVVEADTAEPIPTEEVKYGLRVAVLLMPSHPLLRHPESLKWVSPQAFHYPDSIQFTPYKERRAALPIPLM